MLPDERKREIVQLVTARDGCSVEELASQLGVSKTTIRRDLNDLDQQNLVDRTHGGAIPVVDRVNEYEQRTIQNREAKEAIAERAAAEVHEEQVVAFDSGSTTLEVSRQTPDDLSFAVLTNHPMIAYELGGGPADVRLTGGKFELEQEMLVGPLVETAVERMNFDLAFIGAEGIAADASVTTAFHDAAKIKRLFIANSRRSVVVADGSKLDNRSVVEFCDFSEIDLLVTEVPVPPDLRGALLDYDVAVADDLTP